MSLRSMTFVTTRPNRCKHLWLSLLQKLIILISLTGCIAAPTAKRGFQRWRATPLLWRGGGGFLQPVLSVR